jgi:hypothetical protein
MKTQSLHAISHSKSLTLDRSGLPSRLAQTHSRYLLQAPPETAQQQGIADGHDEDAARRAIPREALDNRQHAERQDGLQAVREAELVRHETWHQQQKHQEKDQDQEQLMLPPLAKLKRLARLQGAAALVGLHECLVQGARHQHKQQQQQQQVLLPPPQQRPLAKDLERQSQEAELRQPAAAAKSHL